MGSLETPTKLLLVDFNNENLKPGSTSWAHACNDIRTALEDHGCFIALYDKVSPQLHNSIFHASQQLFDLPFDKKILNTNEKPYHGYVGQIPFIPYHEAFGIDHATTMEGVQSFSNLMWSGGNHSFSENSHLFSKIVAELEEKVLRMLFESYGVEKHYDSYVESTDYLLRYMKYEVPESDENNVVFPCHTDKTFMTVLYQLNQVSGLEVQARNGEWISALFPPSSFIVMAGEAIKGWSNGRVLAPIHKVTLDANGKEKRYSVGIFTFLNNSKTIEVPEELVDDEHALQFKPFLHLDMVKFFNSDKGRRSQNLLKDFCGV
nr:2-oxoglutarate-dependent dioxygenase AOP2-like [Ipomoea trifida]